MTWLLFFGVLIGNVLVAWLAATFPHVFFGIVACAFLACGGYALAIDGDIACGCLLILDGAGLGWICFDVARMDHSVRTKPARRRVSGPAVEARH